MSRLIKAEVSGWWNEVVVGTDDEENKRLAEIKKLQISAIPERLKKDWVQHHATLKRYGGWRDIDYLNSDELAHLALKVTIKEISPSNDYF